MTPACAAIFSASRSAAWTTRARFEGDADRLAVAVPEIYALPVVGDRVVLNVTDALLGQYQGGPRGFLQYSTVLDHLVEPRSRGAGHAGAEELERERRARHARNSSRIWKFTATPPCFNWV